MEATVEISMYPLTEDYEAPIIAFIEPFQKHPAIEVVVHGLSTHLFGEYDVLMDVLKEQMGKVFNERRAVFNIRIGSGKLDRDQLPDVLK